MFGGGGGGGGELINTRWTPVREVENLLFG